MPRPLRWVSPTDKSLVVGLMEEASYKAERGGMAHVVPCEVVDVRLCQELATVR